MHRNYRRKASGVAAVELAVLLPVLFVLMAAGFYLSTFMYYYTVVQKASQSAARYLSGVKLNEMRSPVLARGAVATAEAIGYDMISDLKAGEGALVFVTCDDDACTGGNSPPTHVRVVVEVRLKDVFFGVADAGDYGIKIKGRSTFRYTGY
jgi:hypothetical protein